MTNSSESITDNKLTMDVWSSNQYDVKGLPLIDVWSGKDLSDDEEPVVKSEKLEVKTEVKKNKIDNEWVKVNIKKTLVKKEKATSSWKKGIFDFFIDLIDF